VFRIKICGITSASDAEAAVSLGADAVGINFYPGSPRCVGLEEAARIVRAAGSALTVGVFVNERPERVNDTCGRLGIGAVQLAGDEGSEEASAVAFRTIRTVRPGPGGVFEPGPGYPCHAFLLDARVVGRYGGTGNRIDWHRAAAWVEAVRDRARREGVPAPPCILAGGLTPANVAEAVRLVRPDGVDVASGVERHPGAKDRGMMAAFIRNALDGFAGAVA